MLNDPYLLPNGTLENKLGILDQNRLNEVEGTLVAFREMDLRTRLPRPPFTFATWKAIHQELFQDVYKWAGVPRTVRLGKQVEITPGSGITWFAAPAEIEKRGASIFDELAHNQSLIGLEYEAFAGKAAELFAKLNNLHPFREGNGRSQNVLLSAIAKAGGRNLAFDVVTRERMITVSIAASRENVAPATRLFEEISDDRRVAALRKALAALQRDRSLAWNDLYIATTRAGQTYRGRLAGLADSDFMMRVKEEGREWIAIGHTADLPAGKRSGDELTVHAAHFETPRFQVQSRSGERAESSNDETRRRIHSENNRSKGRRTR